jgi:transcriptional antiterminator RfaH
MNKWYAIYTKPRYEEHVTERLMMAGIECINPKLKHMKYLRGRYIRTIEPLFPCYIFCHFNPTYHYHMIKYTRGVKYIVGKENPIEIPEEVINGIIERLKGGVLEISSRQFRKGEEVVIKDGPFKDFFGIFDRYIKGSERVLLLLKAIHGRLEVDSWMVQPVNR